jgi:hypothetical protein
MLKGRTAKMIAAAAPHMSQSALPYATSMPKSTLLATCTSEMAEMMREKMTV